MRKPWWAVLGIVVLAAGLGSWRVCSARTEAQHQRSEAMTKNLLSKQKSYPVGRFLVDLPWASDDLSWVAARNGAGSYIEISQVGLEEARRIVEARAEEWRAKRFDPEEDPQQSPLLERLVESRRVPNTWVLFFWQLDYAKIDSLKCEAFHWQKGRLFKFKRWGGEYSSGEPGRAEVVRRLEALFGSLQVQDPGTIPVEPGFCFEGTIMRGSPTADESGEQVTVRFGLRNHPDVSIVLRIYTNDRKELDPPLLELHRRQMADLRREMPWGSVKELRVRESRDVNGLEGQETALRIRCPAGHDYYNLSWGSQGRMLDLYAPWILLEMNVGSAPDEETVMPPSLDEATILKVWDSIVDSLRIRPTGSKATADRVPPKEAPGGRPAVQP